MRQVSKDPDKETEESLIQKFGSLIQGTKILGCQHLSYQEGYKNPMTQVRIPRSGDQSPSGFFSFAIRSIKSTSLTLNLRVWSNRFKKLKSKRYPGYYEKWKESEVRKRRERDYITISDFYPLDEYRFALLEYHTSTKYERDWKRIESRPNSELELELERDQMFQLAYLDIRTSKIKRFRVEAANLILNRMLIWERGSSQDRGEAEEGGSVGGSGGLVIADFDEDMNLVLIDLDPVLNSANPTKE